MTHGCSHARKLWKDPEGLLPVEAANTEVAPIQSEYLEQTFPDRDPYESGIGEIHGKVRVTCASTI